MKDRLRTKAGLEKRIEVLISGHYRERDCLRLVKRLKREKGMLFTFLENKECDWNNNAAERAIRPSVVVRKVTYGNKSLDGAKAHAVLMSIRETCRLRGQNFYDYLKYLAILLQKGKLLYANHSFFRNSFSSIFASNRISLNVAIAIGECRGTEIVLS